MEPKQDYASKVRALLAKAERTDNEAERDACQAMAAKLIAKWSIDVATLTESRVSERMVMKTVEVTGIYSKQLIGLAHRMGLAMRTLEGFTSGSGKTLKWTFVGYETDVERAELLYTSLQLQALTGMQRWWRDYDPCLKEFMSGMEGFVARRSFIDGFTSSVVDRISKMYAEAVEETTSTGTDLVLRDRKTAVTEWLHLQVSLRKGRTMTRRHDYSANDAGRAAGRTADIGAGRLDGGRRALGG